MTRKKILVVAMLDSIHTYRWLAQFSDQEIDFEIFPSKKFRKLHPELESLLESSTTATFKLVGIPVPKSLRGYCDFATHVLPLKFIRLDLRVESLRRSLLRNKYEFIHALEIQGAGYLVTAALPNMTKKPKFIVTNWGSDIYFYEQFPEHRVRIIETLKFADYYSAECLRDYELARALGFKGSNLPCIPNAGGFTLPDPSESVRTSKRSTIVAKTYGGVFGQGELIISALARLLINQENYDVFFYSVTDELVESVNQLSEKHPGRIRWSTRREPLSRIDMRALFLKSRIYVGASLSDGISTSFLEALVYGAYPIQTNTSCAGDWIELGAKAQIVGLDSSEIESAILQALNDDVLVDEAQQANMEISREYLENEIISKVARSFYD